MRIALGGVAHMPWRAHRAEHELRGGSVRRGAGRAAADSELARAEPLRDNAYKVMLARNMIVATLMDLAG